MNRSLRLLIVLLVATLATVGTAIGRTPAGESSRRPLRLGFLENRGQLDVRARFYGASSAAAVFFTDEGPIVELHQFVASDDGPGRLGDRRPSRSREDRQVGSMRRYAVAIRFAGASGPAQVEAVGDPLAERRYFIGAAMATGGVAAYESVAYRGVWPGVDVVFSADGDGLRYELRARAGALIPEHPFAYEGASAVSVNEATVVLDTPLGAIEDCKGTARNPGGSLRWSAAELDGSPAATSQDALTDATRQAEVQQSWGTFLGGSRDDSVYALALDAQGRPIVVGTTRSTDFPTTIGALDTTYGGSFDVFVARLSADGTALEWSSYIGGSGDDRGWAVALDATGRPVVAGVTGGDGFPTTTGAYDESHNGVYDAFVLVLSGDGSALVWSTYYGGSQSEWDVSGLAVDGLNRPIVVGSTRSDDLPTSAAALDSTLSGTTDAFIACLSADGRSLDYATYLGGTADDAGEDVAIDATGRAVVTGRTTSTDFPVTPGAAQPIPDVDSQDGFVSCVPLEGSAMPYSTYLGGDGNDEPYAVALDDLQQVVVAGRTDSADFPTTPDAFEPLPIGLDDAFVTKLAADGTAIVWSSYFGGSSADRALSLVPDGPRGFVFSGWTCSEDLPVTPNAFSSEYMGPCDAFLARLADDGASLSYASYLGGWLDDSAFAVAVDASERMLVGGETWSSDFPVTATSYDPTHNSPDTAEDGFVMAIGAAAVCTALVLGAEGPVINLGKAPDGACPDPPPLAAPVDLVEGSLEALSTMDIGTVDPLICGASQAVSTSVSLPDPGSVRFQLARLSSGGAYTDGAGPGLVGDRVPLSGDCP